MICRAALEQHVAASDQAAFEGCFRTACGQAIFENWGKNDEATQAALDLLDFGNDLLRSIGPSKLPASLLTNATSSSTVPTTGPITAVGPQQQAAQPSHLPKQQYLQQPTAFWQGGAGPELAKYLTLPAPPQKDSRQPTARARLKPAPKAEQPSKGGVKRKKLANYAPAKKQRTTGKKTWAKGLPANVQKHLAVFLTCMDAADSAALPSSWQVTFRFVPVPLSLILCRRCFCFSLCTRFMQSIEMHQLRIDGMKPLQNDNALLEGWVHCASGLVVK